MNIEELISQYIDGTLSTEAESELHHRLAVSPEARKLFRAHIVLRGVARDQRVLHAPTQGMRSRLFERLQREEGMTALADPPVAVALPSDGDDEPALPVSAASGGVPHSIPSANLSAPHRRRRRAAPWLITLVIAGAMFVMFLNNASDTGTGPNATKVAQSEAPQKSTGDGGGESNAKNGGGATPAVPAPHDPAFKSGTYDASGHGLNAESRSRADSTGTALVASADAPVVSPDGTDSRTRPARTVYRYSSRPSRLARADGSSRRTAIGGHGLLASGYSEPRVLDGGAAERPFHTTDAELPARAAMAQRDRSGDNDEFRAPELVTSAVMDDRNASGDTLLVRDGRSSASGKLGEWGGSPILSANTAKSKVASVEPEKLKADSDLEGKDIAAASIASNERFGASMPKKLEPSKTDGAAPPPLPPPPPATLGRVERERQLPRNEQPRGEAAKPMNVPSAPEPPVSQSEIGNGPALASSNAAEAKSRHGAGDQHLASVEVLEESAPADSVARRKSETIAAQDGRPMSPPPALRIERDSAAAAASITMADTTALRSRDGVRDDVTNPMSISSSPRYVAGLEQHSLASITTLADNATFELVAQTVVRAGLEFADGTSQLVLLVGIAGYRQTETSTLFAVRSGGVTTVLPTPVISTSTTSRFDELWGGVGYRYRLQEGANWGVGAGGWLGAGKRYLRIGLELPVWYRVSGTVRLQVIPIAAYVRRLNVAPATDRTTIDPAQQNGEQRDRVSEPRAGGEILTGFGVGATVTF